MRGVLVHLGPDRSQAEADLIGTGTDSYRVFGEHRNDARIVGAEQGHESIDEVLDFCETLIVFHIHPAAGARRLSLHRDR